MKKIIIIAIMSISSAVAMYASDNCKTSDQYHVEELTLANELLTLSESFLSDYYSPTNMSVTVYCESGTCKGTFQIYLSNGRRYIKFNNYWICIQGKSRFALNGNWYIIR